MAIQIQIRRDTAANWTSVDPTLAEGEFGLETDTNQLKIGDGVLAWTALAYFISGNPFDQDLNTTDAVVFAGLTNNAIIYPTSDGTAGQSIVTDGSGNLSFATAGNPFDQDLNTTDPVVFAGLTNNAIIYPTSDGTAGQVVVTDGSGNLSFASTANPFDQDLNTTDPVVFAGLTNNSIIYPTSDGTVGQVIITDGSGNLSFASTANPFDQDLNTTDPVVFAGLTNNAIIYPTSDGTAGQSIVTDGAGNLSFATAGNPFDQDLNTTDPVVFDKVTLTGPIIETQTAISSSAGMVLLDCDLGNVFTLSLTENIITLNITNIPASGKAIGITLILEADGTQRAIAWPASFLWSGGTAPTITATNAKKDAIVFMTYDAGTTFLAFVAGQNL